MKNVSILMIDALLYPVMNSLQEIVVKMINVW